MILPSELEAKTTIPMIRAIIAQKLINEYGFTQQEVAQVLGVTQAAVSNYVRGARGNFGKRFQWQNDDRFLEMVERIVTAIVERKDEMTVNKMICECLQWLRKSRLLCDFHKRLEPSIDVERCTVCDA